jgi:hypothetical protein
MRETYLLQLRLPELWRMKKLRGSFQWGMAVLWK